jgi:hypothetical protein
MVHMAIRSVMAALVTAAAGLLVLPGLAQERTGLQADAAMPASELSLCYESCEYDKGRADEACARKRSKEARAKCFSAAMVVYAACRKGCEDRFKGC